LPVLCRNSFWRQSNLSVGLASLHLPFLSPEKEHGSHPSWQGAPFTLTPAFHTYLRGFSAGGTDNTKQHPRVDEAKDILKVTHPHPSCLLCPSHPGGVIATPIELALTSTQTPAGRLSQQYGHHDACPHMFTIGPPFTIGYQQRQCAHLGF